MASAILDTNLSDKRVAYLPSAPGGVAEKGPWNPICRNYILEFRPFASELVKAIMDELAPVRIATWEEGRAFGDNAA